MNAKQLTSKPEKKSIVENTEAAQDRMLRAEHLATLQMEADGLRYPLRNDFGSTLAYLNALDAYRQKAAAYNQYNYRLILEADKKSTTSNKISSYIPKRWDYHDAY